MPPTTSWQRRSDDRLEITSGGGALSLLGIPFLAAGIFMILAAFRIVPFDNAASIDYWTYSVIFIMGLAFTGIGGFLVFGRTWIVIDRSNGTMQILKGLLEPMRREARSLTGFTHVILRFSPGDTDSADTYHVVLAGEAVTESDLSSSTDYAAAYHQAAYMAEFLHLPLEDATSDTVRRTAPSDLGLALPSRLKADRFEREYATQPLMMKCTIERNVGELKITMPAEPFRLWRQIPALAILGFTLYARPTFDEFLDGTKTPEEIQSLIYIFLTFFFIVLPLYCIIRAIMQSRLGYSRLTVTAHELILSYRKILKSGSTRIDLDKVLDIDFLRVASKRAAARDAAHDAARARYPGRTDTAMLDPRVDKFLSWVGRLVKSGGLIVKTTDGLHSFGAGLPDDELEFLCSTIKDWLRHLRL